MADDPKGNKSHLPRSARETSEPSPTSDVPQLSPSGRVHTDVSSVAMDRGLLAIGGVPSQARVAEIDPSTVGEGLSDAEIMLKAKAGNNSAFEYLVQKYRRPMVNFMYRMVHNAGAAEDLAQEVFLRVYRSRETYEASAKFTTWLYRIATNLAVNYARDTRYQRPENTVSLDEQDEESGRSLDVPDAAPTVEEMMVRRERQAAIRQRVQALPERQRLAVVMHKYQQMDYHQIAEVLKLSESATKSLLFRAYETLREQLKQFI